LAVGVSLLKISDSAFASDIHYDTASLSVRLIISELLSACETFVGLFFF